jgi:hypothetical protein
MERERDREREKEIMCTKVELVEETKGGGMQRKKDSK